MAVRMPSIFLCLHDLNPASVPLFSRMAISMGEATRTLQQMMPDMDAEVIASVLESHGGHMERAVESLLAIGGDSPMHRSSINDHSPSRHSLALSTPSQPMASPRETEQVCVYVCMCVCVCVCVCARACVALYSFVDERGRVTEGSKKRSKDAMCASPVCLTVC